MELRDLDVLRRGRQVPGEQPGDVRLARAGRPVEHRLPHPGAQRLRPLVHLLDRQVTPCGDLVGAEPFRGRQRRLRNDGPGSPHEAGENGVRLLRRDAVLLSPVAEVGAELLVAGEASAASTGSRHSRVTIRLNVSGSLPSLPITAPAKPGVNLS
ncbi:hypothetical protein [Actinoplanes sp. URMC 104]|uniref:hypothetical protein n=1 Tax=Actinoplanes sp. URMC 104 TaxID=3423409 RepID=UPI003F1CDCB7